MDLEDPTPSTSLAKCCDDCRCSSLTCQSISETELRSVKRRLNDKQENGVIIPGFDLPHIARVEIGNECDALCEMVTSQRQAIQDLSLELEEERSASASAANETMSMILRLQSDKAEIQMEARQFKRYAEEKMAHDLQELSAMDDLLYKREMAIESLYSEVLSYKHRMKSYGLSEFEANGEEGCTTTYDNGVGANFDTQCEIATFNYPPLRCSFHGTLVNAEVDNGVVDVDKYAFGDTPRCRDHLKDLEYRINQLEKSPRQILPDEEFSGGDDVFENVIVGQSPQHHRQFKIISTDSSDSLFVTVTETGSDFKSPRLPNSFQTMEYSRTEEYAKWRKVDNGSETGDDTRDRVCITESKSSLGVCGDFLTTPKGSLNRANIEDPEIQKLYARLQALEADRESMRKTLNSMQTDKAQVVFLKEIAQRLCKEMSPARKMPTKKPFLFGSFSFRSVFKWMASFGFWRTKARRSKYMFGMSARNVGLLMLLDKGPRGGRWRCLLSTEV